MDKEDTVVHRTGARLRHFRILKGISQEQLALDCDLNINQTLRFLLRKEQGLFI